MKKAVFVLMALALLSSLLCGCGGKIPPEEETDVPEEPPVPVISYNCGTAFAVFALDVPDGPSVEVGQDFMRIKDEDAGWYIESWSMLPGPFTTATSAASYIDWYTQNYGSVVEECTIGEAQGYTTQVVIDGVTVRIVYAFDGLAGYADTWGAIEISNIAETNGDAAQFLENATLMAILNSAHAPE